MKGISSLFNPCDVVRIKLTGTPTWLQPSQGRLGGETGQGEGKNQQKPLNVTLPLIKGVSAESTIQAPTVRLFADEEKLSKENQGDWQSRCHTQNVHFCPFSHLPLPALPGLFFLVCLFSQPEVQWSWQAGVQDQNWTNKQNNASEIVSSEQCRVLLAKICQELLFSHGYKPLQGPEPNSAWCHISDSQATGKFATTANSSTFLSWVAAAIGSWALQSKQAGAEVLISQQLPGCFTIASPQEADSVFAAPTPTILVERQVIQEY